MKLVHRLNQIATDIAAANLRARQEAAKTAFDEMIKNVITPAAENGKFDVTVKGIINPLVWRMLEDEGLFVVKKHNGSGYDTIVCWKDIPEE